MRIMKASLWYSSDENPPNSITRYVFSGERIEALGRAADFGLSLREWFMVAPPYEGAPLQVFELMASQPPPFPYKPPVQPTREGSFEGSMEHPPTDTTRFIFVGPFWEAARAAALLDLRLAEWILVSTARPLQVFERVGAPPPASLRQPPTARVQAKAAQMKVESDRKVHRETPDRIRRLAEWREPGLPDDSGASARPS